MGMLHPHGNATCITPNKHEICPFLTGDTNPQSCHWNNGKTKTAYNSAYVQIETYNFTFAQQVAVVYFYLCSNFQDIAMPNIKLHNAHCL